MSPKLGTFDVLGSLKGKTMLRYILAYNTNIMINDVNDLGSVVAPPFSFTFPYIHPIPSHPIHPFLHLGRVLLLHAFRDLLQLHWGGNHGYVHSDEYDSQSV